jgi:glycosyltransferase involved in cell wall biosynthesis
MRICFISSYPPIECGIGTYTEALNEALMQSQNETFVMSQFGAQGEKVFPIFHPENPSFAADVFFTSIRMTPDVVHIQHEYGLYGQQKGVEAVELMLRYQMAGVPVVTTLHTVNEDSGHQEKIILKYIVEISSAVIVHEQYQKDYLASLFGSPEKIYVIEHGIREQGPVPNAKKKLGLTGKKVILLIGYFRPTKNFDKIVDIFPAIHEKSDNSVLVVAGKVRNPVYDNYARDLYQKLNSSNFSDCIEIYRGQFPQYTFDTILSAADAVVLPYSSGGQSGILAQCMAMHKPVVTSNLEAFKNIIERSGCGIICKDDNDYIENIAQLLNSHKLQKDFRNNIKNYIQNNAGWRVIAKNHIDIYHSVITVPYGKARYVYFPESKKQTNE